MGQITGSTETSCLNYSPSTRWKFLWKFFSNLMYIEMPKKIKVVDIESMSEIIEQVKIPKNNIVAFDPETEREIGHTIIETTTLIPKRGKPHSKQPPPQEEEKEDTPPKPEKRTRKKPEQQTPPPKEEQEEEEEEEESQPEENQPEEQEEQPTKPTKEDRYIICEHCQTKLKEKTYKYSHKNNCRGLKAKEANEAENRTPPPPMVRQTRENIRQQKMIELARQAFK